jgi:hypothetical protein
MTAHDLAADWQWMEQHVGFRVVGGSVVWEDAQYPERSNGQRVRIARIDVAGGHPRTIARWVAPGTPCALVPR